jgi:prepilin-type N-terminal cleavage/methylation domain-containing protein
MYAPRRDSGFSLTEVVVVTAIIGVMASMAVPGTQRWLNDQDAGAMARTVSNAFHVARQEAMRTGRNQVVFFSAGGAGDVIGNPLLDASGQPVAALILDDGPTGAPGQNCQIDAGEPTRTIAVDANLAWGFSFAAGTKAPGDTTAVPIGAGSSFATPTGAATTWVMFRPDGTPVAFDAACGSGSVGSGSGAIYFTNGNQDYAVVLNALGGTRVHAWDRSNVRWSN